MTIRRRKVTVKGLPIQQRIHNAMAGRTTMSYYELMVLVFPDDQYPGAMMNSSNGGPPGCAMAFGKAIRTMGGMRIAEPGHHGRKVYIPLPTPSNEIQNLVGVYEL